MKAAEEAKWATLRSEAEEEAAAAAAAAAERADARMQRRAARQAAAAAAERERAAARERRSAEAVADHARRLEAMARDPTTQALRQLSACTSLDLSRQVRVPLAPCPVFQVFERQVRERQRHVMPVTMREQGTRPDSMLKHDRQAQRRQRLFIPLKIVRTALV